MTSMASAAIPEMELRDQPNSSCQAGMASESAPRAVKARARPAKPSATTPQARAAKPCPE